MSSHMSAQPLPGPGSKNARAGAGRALLSTGVREKGGSATSEARPSSARSASSIREDAHKYDAGAWLLAGGCFGGAPRGFFMLTAR
jgi:hypothetical protein